MTQFKATVGGIAVAVLAAGALAETPSKAVSNAVGAQTRSAAHKARDDMQKPTDILAFAGVKPGHVVADLGAGGGYYAAILSRVVGAEGTVYAANPSRLVERFATIDEGFKAYLRRETPDNVVYTVAKFDELTFEAPLDAAFMVLMYHDAVWSGVDRAQMNKRIYDALKPGGVYLVIDHAAQSGSGARDVQTLQRIEGETVRTEIEKAGFTFVGESNALANPNDPRTENVFGSLRGRTDRFVYLFQK
ncbi:MAG: methyltransferase domain-containing protein [Pseudomonadota bacterium]